PMNLIHQSTPTAGNRSPSRPAMVRRAQCSTPFVSNSSVSAGMRSAPLRSGGGEPMTVSVISRPGRRAAPAGGPDDGDRHPATGTARGERSPDDAADLRAHQVEALSAERVHEAAV